MLNDILWPDNIHWQPPTDQTLYRTRPFTEYLEVSIEHLRRMWYTDRGRSLPPDTWSYPIWDLRLSIQPKPQHPLVTLSEHDLFTDFYITEFERFQQNICNGWGMLAGDPDSSGHLVLSLWDLHMFYLLRPILLSLFSGLCSSNIPRYFLHFAFSGVNTCYQLSWALPVCLRAFLRCDCSVSFCWKGVFCFLVLGDISVSQKTPRLLLLQ